ncbi:dTDP-4-dehydrorhamnose 3,5-epimerase [Roseomonas sp. KE2513]|uniref:dTDP-4-dehydrorhamnose 3,5-epimerase n=1 Tax=Roseomonas sp. KE2513 TaxID=2479202 RepID=UPI0018DF5B11|nr:dTDP-4-dehydrorhamnose 3,5-epimerase [Roseomonas sp. KE2513]MBI0534914.1 dTDP-4-dehydrorhamnose 3,5-epimerase [Roseomonas sp. KE2513]
MSVIFPPVDLQRLAVGAPRTSGNVTALPLGIEGPLLLGLRRIGDLRGYFMETYSERDFRAVGVDARFVQDNQSLSARVGTLRGLHFQTPPHAQAKLVRVVRGAVLDIAVDIRRDSPGFGRHVACHLTADGAEQLYIPAGFAHGFVTLASDTEVAYKVSDHYAPECDRGIAWDDPDLGLPWPELPGGPILSEKDRTHPRLRDLPPLF